MLADDEAHGAREQGDHAGLAGRRTCRAAVDGRAHDLQPIWSQLSEKVVRFEDSFERSQRAASETLLGDIGLEAPKEVHGMTEFVSDRTSSNMAGVTLMNNQVGYVVADVMRGKEGVTVTELPSMIRVDGVQPASTSTTRRSPRRSGWDDFGNDDFEEIMSTHYGRMVVLDDRVSLFANPEDAAEYIGFDLQPVE